MYKIQEIKVYETSDGRTYRTAGEAHQAQRKIDFANWYKTHEMQVYHHPERNYITSDEMFKWAELNCPLLIDEVIKERKE